MADESNLASWVSAVWGAAVGVLTVGMYTGGLHVKVRRNEKDIQDLKAHGERLAHIETHIEHMQGDVENMRGNVEDIKKMMERHE